MTRKFADTPRKSPRDSDATPAPATLRCDPPRPARSAAVTSAQSSTPVAASNTSRAASLRPHMPASDAARRSAAGAAGTASPVTPAGMAADGAALTVVTPPVGVTVTQALAVSPRATVTPALDSVAFCADSAAVTANGAAAGSSTRTRDSVSADWRRRSAGANGAPGLPSSARLRTEAGRPTNMPAGSAANRLSRRSRERSPDIAPKVPPGRLSSRLPDRSSSRMPVNRRR